MPAYNFKDYLAPKVEDGSKRTTIRKNRKRNPKPGELLYLYTGMRTKQCRKLREESCKSIKPIYIDDAFVTLDGKKIDWDVVHTIAVADGFKGIKDFLNFFDAEYGLPFDDGVLIEW